MCADTVTKTRLCKHITFSKATIQYLFSHCIKTLSFTLTFFPLFYLSIFCGPYEKTAYRNCSHLEYWTLKRELFKPVLLGSQCDQGLGQYSCPSFTMDKLCEWVPSVCYPDLRSRLTKKLSFLVSKLDRRREQETLSSPCCLAEPYIAQTSPETALGKGQTC